MTDQAVNLDGVDTQRLRELHYLLDVLQMGHQHGRDIRRSRRDELGRPLGCESVVASMGDAADEADGVRAGRDRDCQVGRRANATDLDSWARAHRGLSHSPSLHEVGWRVC